MFDPIVPTLMCVFALGPFLLLGMAHAHDNEQQQPGRPFEEERKQLGMLLAIAQMVCAPAEIWLRRGGTFGEKYLGYHLGMGLLLMFMAPPLFFPADDARPLLLAWGTTLVMAAAHRIKGAWLRRRGRLVHSQYSGDSVFGDGIWVKQHLEPGACIFGGLAMCFLSPPLGAWMIASGLCLGFCVAWNAERDAARVRAMRDAQIENSYYADRFKQEGGD